MYFRPTHNLLAMKFKFIVWVTLCILVYEANAQVIPIYFSGNAIVNNKNQATSYAVYGKLSDQELWTFKRYDLSDNLLQTGSYKDERLTTPHGVFNFYMDLDQFNTVHLTNYKLKKRYRFLSQVGNFVNGLEDGKWQLFYPDGTLLNSQFYVKGKLHGEFITYDRRGDIEIKGSYVDGNRDGHWIFGGGEQEAVYDNGKLISSGFVSKKKKTKSVGGVGLRIANANAQRQRNAAKDINVPNPTREIDQLIDVETFNRRNGTSYKAPAGTEFRMLTGTLVNGVESGEWSWFFPDGKVRAVVNFSNGKANGDFVRYDAKGKVHSKGTYVDGKREGEWLVAGKKNSYKNGVAKNGSMGTDVFRNEDVTEMLTLKEADIARNGGDF